MKELSPDCCRMDRLNNLNTVNELIEYGFIQENDYRKITLHPLIQEIAIDDTKPSIENCAMLIEIVRIQCIYHGLDLPVSCAFV